MPLFNLQDFYKQPAIPCQNIHQLMIFDNETIEFKYNSYGYRTHEFVNVKTHIAVSGCSLTEGHGLHLHQTWAKKLELQTNLKVFNLAKGGSSADFVSQVLQNWVGHYTPNLVIAQWPNPYRSLTWNNAQVKFNINSDHDKIYQTKIMYGIENFYQPWCSNIISLNQFCKLKKVPIINVCFESYGIVSPVLDILNQFEIDLHYDKKTEGQTWHFDNNALDGSHHSEWCNSRWTDRILTIINNLL